MFLGKLLADSINDLFLSREVILRFFLLNWGNPKALTSVVKRSVTLINIELSEGLWASMLKDDRIGSKFEFLTDS